MFYLFVLFIWIFLWEWGVINLKAVKLTLIFYGYDNNKTSNEFPLKSINDSVPKIFCFKCITIHYLLFKEKYKTRERKDQLCQFLYPYHVENQPNKGLLLLDLAISTFLAELDIFLFIKKTSLISAFETSQQNKS